jgi:hypothetical protein
LQNRGTLKNLQGKIIEYACWATLNALLPCVSHARIGQHGYQRLTRSPPAHRSSW